jgi:hypothetical protein
MYNVAGGIPPFLAATPQIVSTLLGSIADSTPSLGAGYRGENHADGNANTESEEEIRETFVVIHECISFPLRSLTSLSG